MPSAMVAQLGPLLPTNRDRSAASGMPLTLPFAVYCHSEAVGAVDP